MLLEVEASALLGNAKDLKCVCMDFRFNLVVQSYTFIVFHSIYYFKNMKKKVFGFIFFFCFVFGSLYPLCHMEDSFSGCLSRRVSSVLLHTLLLSLFLVNKKNKKRNTDLIKALTKRHLKKSIKLKLKILKFDSLEM